MNSSVRLLDGILLYYGLLFGVVRRLLALLPAAELCRLLLLLLEPALLAHHMLALLPAAAGRAGEAAEAPFHIMLNLESQIWNQLCEKIAEDEKIKVIINIYRSIKVGDWRLKDTNGDLFGEVANL